MALTALILAAIALALSLFSLLLVLGHSHQIGYRRWW